MKRKTLRNALIAAALVLAFAAACGDTPGSTGGTLWSPGAVVIPMEPAASGTFTLGQELSPPAWGNTLQLTTVNLTQSFDMGRYPVTREQWIAVLAGNPNGIPVPHPSWSNAAPNAQESVAAGGFSANRRPVTHVNWYEAIVFANWLSIACGLLPAYEIRCASNDQWTTDPARWGTVPTTSGDPSRPRWDSVRIAPASNGYRLPTEAQWEFAAKGGNTADSYTFSGSDAVGDVAWYSGNSASSPRMVGLLDANGLGLHDMSGNVWEWTQSWIEASWQHPGVTLDDHVGAASGSLRVYRGGSWSSAADSARSVARNGNSPDFPVGVVSASVLCAPSSP